MLSFKFGIVNKFGLVVIEITSKIDEQTDDEQQVFRKAHLNRFR